MVNNSTISDKQAHMDWLQAKIYANGRKMPLIRGSIGSVSWRLYLSEKPALII